MHEEHLTTETETLSLFRSHRIQTKKMVISGLHIAYAGVFSLCLHTSIICSEKYKDYGVGPDPPMV